MSDAIDKAVADMPNATRGGCVCPMCGHNYPHTHTPEEITIFRNGAKFERKSAAPSTLAGQSPIASPTALHRLALEAVIWIESDACADKAVSLCRDLRAALAPKEPKT